MCALARPPVLFPQGAFVTWSWGMHMAVGACCCYCTSFLIQLVLRGSHASPSELAPLVYKVEYVK